MHYHLHAHTMEHEILCFQKLLSATPLALRAGGVEETQGKWCAPCDRSYDMAGRAQVEGFITPERAFNRLH